MRDTKSVLETFLAGGGDMGKRVRAHDWAATPLGSPDKWPMSLLTMVCACLNSQTLSTVLWGPDLVMIYNDAYIPSMADRHPSALGRPVADVWGDTWELVAPPFRQAMATGQGFAQNRVELPMIRRGQPEVSYWNFTATPIRGEGGVIEGLLNQGTEITAAVQAENALRRSDERHRRLLQQMPGFVAVTTGADHVYEYVNDAFVALAGPRQVIGLRVRDAFPELAGQGFHELVDQVFATGASYAAKGVPFRLADEGRDRFTDLTYQPIRADDGTITGIFIGGYEVTEQNQAAEALRALNADLKRKVTERALARSRTWQLSPDVMGVLNTEGYFEQSIPPGWFDVVFSDVMMPGMAGVELGQEIRRLYHDLTVVLTSGYSHVLAQNGTYGFELLHKPYSVEQLSQILRKAASWQRRARLLGR